MKKNHTFEEIRINSQNKDKKSDESQAYENARNQLENYICDTEGTDVNLEYDSDLALEEWLLKNPEKDSFDIDGNMNILKDKVPYEQFDETWNFMITEHLTKTVRVRAKNRREAYGKITTLLSSDLLTLGADDFSDRDIQGLDEVNEENPEVINDSSYPVDEDYSEKI